MGRGGSGGYPYLTLVPSLSLFIVIQRVVSNFKQHHSHSQNRQKSNAKTKPPPKNKKITWSYHYSESLVFFSSIIIITLMVYLSSESIGYCKKLRSLILTENNIVTLPDTLVECQQLHSLECGGNRFKEFPPMITKLKKLKRLSLQRLCLNGRKNMLACIVCFF